MLTALSSFIDRIPDSKVNLVKLREYTFLLLAGTYRTLAVNNKFVNNPVPSVALDLINGFLIRCDMDYLLRYKNDVERFGKIMKLFKSPVFSSYIYNNPVIRNGLVTNTFYDTNEYILPTLDIDAMTSLPLESDDIKDWSTLRPFRMLACASLELNMDNLATRFKFTSSQPYEAMFSVNIPILLMLYTKYCLLKGEVDGEGTNRYPFIYKTCIMPLLYDHSRAWILEIMNTMLMNVAMYEDREITSNKVDIGNRASFARERFDPTMIEMREAMIKVRDGKMKADTLMQSLSLRYGFSLVDEVSFIRDNNFIPGNIQYYWLTFLGYYELMILILNVYSLDGGSRRYDEMRKILRIKVRRLKNTKFWQHATDAPTKQSVKIKFNNLEAMIM